MKVLCSIHNSIFSPQSYNFFCNNPRKRTKFLNLGLLFSSPPLLSSLFLTPDLYTSLLLFCPRLFLTCSFFHTSHLLLAPFFFQNTQPCTKKRSKLKPTPFISHQTIQWLCIQVCLLFSYSLVTFLPLCQNQKVIRHAEAYIWLFVAQSLLLTPPS